VTYLTILFGLFHEETEETQKKLRVSGLWAQKLTQALLNLKLYATMLWNVWIWLMLLHQGMKECMNTKSYIKMSVFNFCREMTHLTLQLALKLVLNIKEHSAKPRCER
jgi:hypothetical protein